MCLVVAWFALVGECVLVSVSLWCLVAYCLVLFGFGCIWVGVFGVYSSVLGGWCVVIAVGVGFLIGCGCLVLCFVLSWWVLIWYACFDISGRLLVVICLRGGWVLLHLLVYLFWLMCYL